jgi:hypothetical protein
MQAGRQRANAAQAVVILVAALLVLWAWRADLVWFERHVYPGYCAVSHGQTVWPTVARILALLVAAALVLFARPRLARWAERSSAVDLALVGAAIGAALVVSELLLRRHPVGDATPLTRKDMPKAIADPRVGWRFAPSQAFAFAVRGRRVEYAIDRDGDRAPRVDSRIDPARPTLIVAGESIAFGESLPWNDTFAARLGAELDLQVVDVGAPAYGSDQAFQRAMEALARVKKPVALVTVFVPQLVRRNGLTGRPHLTLSDGLLVPVAAEDHLALTRLWRDEPYHGDRALDLTRAVLAATVRRAREHGAAPLFVVTNFGAACSDDAWLLRTLFAEGGLPHVRVTLGPGETIGGGDLHPNALGARKLAAAAAAALRAR